MQITFFFRQHRRIQADRPITQRKIGCCLVLLLGWRIQNRTVAQDATVEIMHRNAQPATEFFHIPPGRVIELGGQVEM